MEQQFIMFINDKITEHYKRAKSLLHNKDNYKTLVDTQNVSLYFTFLESVLQQPYNRLNSVSVFIVGDDGQLTYRMYPFGLLNEKTKDTIAGLYSQAVKLATSLEVSGIDPEVQSLCKEKNLPLHNMDNSLNKK